MKKILKLGFPLGMASVAVYFIHVFVGQALWPEYDPITMDISSLTAEGAPNAGLLRVFTSIYGTCLAWAPKQFIVITAVTASVIG